MNKKSEYILKATLLLIAISILLIAILPSGESLTLNYSECLINVTLPNGSIQNICAPDAGNVTYINQTINYTAVNTTIVRNFTLKVNPNTCQFVDGNGMILQEIDKHLDSGEMKFNMTYICPQIVNCSQDVNQSFLGNEAVWLLMTEQTQTISELTTRALQEGDKFEQNRLIAQKCELNLEDCTNETSRLYIENGKLQRDKDDIAGAQIVFISMIIVLFIFAVIGMLSYVMSKRKSGGVLPTTA